MNILNLFFSFIKAKIFRFPVAKRKFFLTAIFLTLLLIFIIVVFSKDFGKNKEMEWGVTYSKKHATQLGLNWQKTYLEILYDLNVKNLRIPVYWDEVEIKQGQYDFSDYDWMVDAAKIKNVKVVLVLGRRLPRWPECFAPLWSNNMPEEVVQEKLLDFISVGINHFKEYEHIIAWQIENEPLLSVFGECPKPDKDFLKAEVSLAKSLDQRQIILTDSGELSSWFGVGSIADILGTTMYRVVWNKRIGYLYYPFPPAYYKYKADIVKKLNPNLKEVIISELQVEPWSEGELINQLSLERQFKSMSLERMKMNLRFAKATGFDLTYLWGAEWWYWLKTQKNHPEFWQLGKSLFGKLD